MLKQISDLNAEQIINLTDLIDLESDDLNLEGLLKSIIFRANELIDEIDQVSSNPVEGQFSDDELSLMWLQRKKLFTVQNSLDQLSRTL